MFIAYSKAVHYRIALNTHTYGNNFFIPLVIVEKRNARERKRVKAVNEAFAKLRQMVPSVACRGKRVSKVKTLKKAVEYILELKRALDNEENQIRNNRVQ